MSSADLVPLTGGELAPCGPTFLMCSPELYEVNYVINPWMEGNVHASSKREAAAQWERLHAAISRFARVELVEPQPGSPDMVFTANAGLVRHGVVALSRFLHPERQGEEPHFGKWFGDSGFAVREMPRGNAVRGRGRRFIRMGRFATLGRAWSTNTCNARTGGSWIFGTLKLCRCGLSILASITLTLAFVHFLTGM